MYKDPADRKARATRRNSVKETAVVTYKQPSVEDEEDMSLAIVDHPPHCESPLLPPQLPPGAVIPITPTAALDALAFLVDSTPNASSVHIPMTMKSGATKLFDPTRKPLSVNFDFNMAMPSVMEDDVSTVVPQFEYKTPVQGEPNKKKRKKLHSLDMSAANDGDEVMLDAPTLQSGLTGGLDRVMLNTDYPSPSDSTRADIDMMEQREREGSPMKRSRTSQQEQRGFKRAIQEVLGKIAPVATPAPKPRLAESAKKAAESRRRSEKRRSERRAEREARRSSRRITAPPERKAIEYTPSDKSRRRSDASAMRGELVKYQPSPSPSPSPPGSPRIPHPTPPQADDEKDDKVVVYSAAERSASLFLSTAHENLTNAHSCSITKVLKRVGRKQRRLGEFKSESERAEFQELVWRSLRLRRNDQGELVVFVGEQKPQKKVNDMALVRQDMEMESV
jgi:hypothetical protein